MKKSATAILSGLLLLVGVPSSCKGNTPLAGEKNAASEETKRENPTMENRIKISIGAKTFAATLADNPTVSAFKAMLPLSLEMSDLNQNEKVSHLSSRLPSNDKNPGTIHDGDLMLWNSKSLVLFYKTFPTSYSYTKLGRIDNPEGLSAAVGAGDVTIQFVLE
ncbi:cyclophilin-like fold protein [Prosthecobacter sp.]|uniref:cyclophilin-like fold protein n=1 Tax=Prosthecobacter sp. TaxID=1965333 RepID=UPI002487CAC1|nr:cyclophilin-like fold protein [Prosthecobacter sp.]MDI1315624.1 cyclophilin-like fold protein [Prosthecobacter sp.]